MGKASGLAPVGAVLAVIAGLAVAGSGFPFSRHPAAGHGFMPTPARSSAGAHPVSSRRPAPAQPATAGTGPLASGYACGASVVRPGSGALQAAVTCLGEPVLTASPAPGVVAITFRHDVSACSATVAPRLTGLAPGTAPGEITADLGGAGAPGLVTVRTFSQSGQPAVRGFSLVLRCPPGADHGLALISRESGAIAVPCGIAGSGRVLASVQDDSGVRVRSAALDRSRCLIRVGLSAAPRPGRPARVGWLILP